MEMLHNVNCAPLAQATGLATIHQLGGAVGSDGSVREGLVLQRIHRRGGAVGSDGSVGQVQLLQYLSYPAQEIFTSYTGMDVSDPPPTTAALNSLELIRIQQRHLPPNPRNPRHDRIRQNRQSSVAAE
jgi:hypothetical protein